MRIHTGSGQSDGLGNRCGLASETGDPVSRTLHQPTITVIDDGTSISCGITRQKPAEIRGFLVYSCASPLQPAGPGHPSTPALDAPSVAIP